MKIPRTRSVGWQIQNAPLTLSLGLSLLFFIPVHLGCRIHQQDDPSTAYSLFSSVIPPDTLWVEHAELGLQAWEIGLDPNLRARSRNVGGIPGTYNPPNWVAVSGRDCLVMGSPDPLSMACPFVDPSVVGVCQIISDSTDGNILNSTALIAKDFQDDETVPVGDRQSVITHEIGHCLGLQHSGSPADVMYPNTAGADTPSANELAAIQFAYTAFRDPPDSTRFYQSSGLVLRHFSLPGFFLYDGSVYATSSTPQGIIPDAERADALPPTSVPTNPVEIVTFLIFRDGRSLSYRQ